MPRKGKGRKTRRERPGNVLPLQTGVFRDWCEALGLDEETRTYASALAARLEDPQTEARATRLLLEASERFNKGLKGTTTLDKAGRLVADTASMAVHRSSARHIHAMFQTSPEFLAREVLDKHIINLTGLIDANERLDIDETGLELNYDKVDAAMLEQMQTLKGNSEEGINGGEIQQTLQQALEARARTLRGLRARRGRFITGSKAMGEFARAAGESLELRAENARRHETLQNARMEKALMKFAWPHQIREREAVCRDVVRLAEVLQHLNENDPKTLRTLSSRGQTLAEERDSLLRRLADVDLHTMRHTGPGRQTRSRPGSLLKLSCLRCCPEPEQYCILPTARPKRIRKPSAMICVRWKSISAPFFPLRERRRRCSAVMSSCAWKPWWWPPCSGLFWRAELTPRRSVCEIRPPLTR